MRIIKLKYALVLGAKIEEIKFGISQIENMHLGLFINSLRYKDEKEGRKLKNDFFKSIYSSIAVINKEIATINSFIKFFNQGGFKFAIIKKIDYKTIKKIIQEHKGSYPQAEGDGSAMRESLGEGDSPSILARKHTSLRIENILLNTKRSITDFFTSVNDLLDVFNSIDRKLLRTRSQSEIEKAITAYSVGLFGESILIIGRLLENLTKEYLILLKKKGSVKISIKSILALDFHNKIEYLHSLKKPKTFSDSQFSKIMSVKWDRNIYGHNVGASPKDHTAMIMIGLMAVELFEKKLKRVHGKKN